MSPRRLAAPLLVLLAALGLAGPAQAAPAPGLNVSAYPDALGALAQGARQVRFFVPWRNFEPGSPRDFSASGPATPGGLTTDLKVYVERVRAAGATPLLAVLDAPDWAGVGPGATKHPRDAGEYAEFLAELAAWLRPGPGPAPVYEVWNEPDAEGFWGGTPDPAAYTSLLRASYPAVKGADPAATVLSGATTGNNFHWIESLYADGAKGFFDGVAVHTDTGCSVVGPDSFYREPDGRLGQYSFLGYREVRKVMLAHEDPKPIWMTELGWGTTSKTCTIGVWAGQKLAGVTETQQAAFLTQAYTCLADDPYVVSAAWFSYRDDPGEGNHFGLYRVDGSAKPSLAAFAAARNAEPGPCGDFSGPSVHVVSPVAGHRFVDSLDLKADVSDAGAGVARVFYTYDGGKPIRSFSAALSAGGAVGLAPWLGSSALARGPHTIEVRAVDKNGNSTVQKVAVSKVAPGAVEATLRPVLELLGRPRCSTRSPAITCSLRGRLIRAGRGRPSPGGKVWVDWQFRNKRGRYVRLVGGGLTAARPFRFHTRMRRRGAWRVRVTYRTVAPYKAAKSPWVSFRVR